MGKIRQHFTQKNWIILAGLLLIAGVSIFPAALGDFVYWQDDIYFHVNRLESYTESVRHLDFFPRIFSSMGHFYGYGADLFYPSILLLRYALLRISGLEFSQAFYFFHFILSLVTAAIAFGCIKKIGYSAKISLLFAALYTLSTYRLIDQNVRGALGETIAFAFIPLVFYALYQILIAGKKSWLILAVGVSFLVASHLITAFYAVLAVVGFFIAWCLPTKTAEIKRAFLILLKAAAMTLVLTAWFWLPYLEQVAAIEFNFSKTSLWSSGLDFSLGTLLLNSVSNIGRSAEGLQPNFGIVILLALIRGFVLIKKLLPFEKILLMVTGIFIFFSTNLFFWSLFKDSFLAVIQFPWRLLIFVSFFGSFLAVLMLKRLIKLENNFNFLFALWGIFFLAIGFNGNVFARSEYNNSSFVDNTTYAEFDSSELGHGREYVVKDTPAGYYLESPYLRIAGFHQYQAPMTHSYQQDNYELTLAEASQVELPKFYYLGYTVTNNGESLDYSENLGLMSVALPAGKNHIEVSYVGTFLQKISLGISGVGILGGLLYTVVKKRRFNKK